MATTGPRYRFTMYYDTRDETLQTQWFYGAEDGAVPLITAATIAALNARCVDVKNGFNNAFSDSAICVGFKIDSIDRQDTPFYYRPFRSSAVRSGSQLPNNCQLNVLFQGRRDPPLPLPRRSTIRSGMRLCGFERDDQLNGKWTSTFIDDVLSLFLDPIEEDLVVGGDTFVLATGGKGNLFPVDNVIPSTVVGRNITRRANRPQNRRHANDPV